MRFAFHYITWHYSQAILDLIGIVKNFIWFFYNFFSVPTLIKSLFQPFSRLGEAYKKGFDLSSWSETFIVNSLMRLVGFLLRSILIVLGAFLILFTCVVGILFLIAWIFAPFLLSFLLLYGIKLISLG